MENIAILTGGDSAESNISLLSAETVLKYLDKNKYKGVIVNRKNNKYTTNESEIDTTNFSYSHEGKKINFDKVFIALHGPPAENGLIQDYFESINIPYTSCDAKVSALTFDKFSCNKRLRNLGFNCAKSIITNSNFDSKNIEKNIKFPCFVKPNQGGSSYGISKVDNKEELPQAIQKALIYDEKVIIEEFINGVEVSCGVYKDKDKILTLPLTEIISENAFFDYEAKYEGKSREITPARIINKTTTAVKEITKDIYEKMNLTGICRIDFIIQNKVPYIIEINTIPGLSEESIIPKQLKVANINLSEIFNLCLNNIN